MPKHKHADVIKAWADGAIIQFKPSWLGLWRDVPDNNPSWTVGTDYRVKPTEYKISDGVVTIDDVFYWNRDNGKSEIVNADNMVFHIANISASPQFYSIAKPISDRLTGEELWTVYQNHQGDALASFEAVQDAIIANYKKAHNYV